jgi:hypothetical protein
MPERNQEARRSSEMGRWRVRRRDWGADPAGRDPRLSGHPSCEVVDTPVRTRRHPLAQEREFWTPTCTQRLWTPTCGRGVQPRPDPERTQPAPCPIRASFVDTHPSFVDTHPRFATGGCVPRSPCLQGTACRCPELRLGAPSPFDSACALPRASASARCKVAACRASHDFRHSPNGG